MTKPATATTQAIWVSQPFDIVDQLKKVSEKMKEMVGRQPEHLVDAIVIAQKRYDTMKGYLGFGPEDYCGIPLHVVKDDNAVALKLVELNHLNKVALLYEKIGHQIVDLKLLRESQSFASMQFGDE